MEGNNAPRPRQASLDQNPGFHTSLTRRTHSISQNDDNVRKSEDAEDGAIIAALANIAENANLDLGGDKAEDVEKFDVLTTMVPLHHRMAIRMRLVMLTPQQRRITIKCRDMLMTNHTMLFK